MKLIPSLIEKSTERLQLILAWPLEEPPLPHRHVRREEVGNAVLMDDENHDQDRAAEELTAATGEVLPSPNGSLI